MIAGLIGGSVEEPPVGEALDKTETNGYVTCDCGNLLSACLTLLSHSLERRNSYGQKLHNNRAVDVGGNTHREDCRVGERAA